MKKKQIIVGACIMAFGAFSAALVEGNQPEGLSQVEVQHPHAHILTYYFREMDENGDNFVTPKEREKIAEHKRLMEFSDMDENGDGKLSIGEYFRAFSQHHGEKKPGMDI